MIAEFRKFIMRGNVIDLAVGIIIGAAFTAVVNSLVNDIIMPPIGLIVGGVDFSDLVITLRAAEGDNPAVTINIGLFINALINFLIVAVAVFLLVRGVNKLQERMARGEVKPSEAPPPSAEEKLTVAIEKLTAVMESRTPTP